MGQVLHGSAKTTHAVRAAIQRSKATIAELAEQYDLNPKTVMKWRRRPSVEDLPMGPQDARSTVLSAEEEALCVAFRKHTLLPLDDGLYALQASIPHLTLSSRSRWSLGGPNCAGGRRGDRARPSCSRPPGVCAGWNRAARSARRSVPSTRRWLPGQRPAA
jgi:hypothetical protein